MQLLACLKKIVFWFWGISLAILVMFDVVRGNEVAYIKPISVDSVYLLPDSIFLYDSSKIITCVEGKKQNDIKFKLCVVSLELSQDVNRFLFINELQKANTMIVEYVKEQNSERYVFRWGYLRLAFSFYDRFLDYITNKIGRVSLKYRESLKSFINTVSYYENNFWRLDIKEAPQGKKIYNLELGQYDDVLCRVVDKNVSSLVLKLEGEVSPFCSVDYESLAVKLFFARKKGA